MTSKNWTPAQIRELISERQETREVFASKVGVTRGALQHWLNGTRVPNAWSNHRLSILATATRRYATWQLKRG